ncbi:hypothetical protein MKX03_011966 [Papaver bracteatum]|nr:hypothetical protein MKX03_011966 [Papaver bracteatum]
MELPGNSSLDAGNKDVSVRESDMKRMEEISKIMGEMNAEVRVIFARQGLPRSETSLVPPVMFHNPQQVSQGNNVQGCSHDQNNDLLTRFLKLAPHEFSGTPPDPDIAENWIRDAERILKRVGGTMYDWVNIATFNLKGIARYWWESAELAESEPITWKRFKDLFLEEYVTDASRDQKRSEFMYIEHGDMSLAEFANKYRRLSRYAPEITIKDEVNARHFIRALKPRTSEQLAAFQIKTFQEALSRSFSIKRE